MTEEWMTIARAILYGVQSDDLGSPATAHRVATTLLKSPLESTTPLEEYEALHAALQSDSKLTDANFTSHSESDFRTFLAKIMESMDEMRPWPELPFLELTPKRWPEFINAPVIGSIDLSTQTIEDIFGRGFDRRTDRQQDFLLLRLNSGIEIGFIWPYWVEYDQVAIVSNERAVSPGSIMDDILTVARIPPDKVRLMGSSYVENSLETPSYETTPIQASFQGEHLPENSVWSGSQVKYLNSDERAEFLLHPHGGLLYDSKGHPYDTSFAKTLWSPKGGRAIFVMDTRGNIYSAPFHSAGQFHHSSFLAGAPAAGAGEIVVIQGHVKMISDHSSHYQPPRRITRQVLHSLRSKGIEIQDTQVEYHYS